MIHMWIFQHLARSITHHQTQVDQPTNYPKKQLAATIQLYIARKSRIKRITILFISKINKVITNM